MKLYSTNNPSHIVDLQEAVFKGLPPDNGLYMPCNFPKLPSAFFETIDKLTMPEIAVEICNALFNGYISKEDTQNIVAKAINFDAPLVEIEPNTFALELFHGPTLAFKDFGARFMAQLMGYFLQKQNKEIHIIVATSGDTGGAVASGFYNTPGIRVTILYPSGKVSTLQEKQLTTLGKNIQAIEVKGTFDDCQRMVKQAFLDTDVTQKVQLSSANSINIARLIPQSFYYFNSYARLKYKNQPFVFVVPSGNFGNICAGLFAYNMGLPAHKFIAAVNANDTFVRYLQQGRFEPKPSVATLSNAMDVGNPSNFARIHELFDKNLNRLLDIMDGFSFDDQATRQTIREVYIRSGYLWDPHGAVGYLGLKKYERNSSFSGLGVVLHTAHPAKFIDTYDPDLKSTIRIPDALASIAEKPKSAFLIENDYQAFKSYLMST